MYLDALQELVTWFCALDHTNYARWIPVHLRDMAQLPQKYPEVYKEFSAGHFTAQKTSRGFSSIANDQAHGKINAHIKSDGGAVGLIETPSALRRWMISGPEAARLTDEFGSEVQHQKKENM